MAGDHLNREVVKLLLRTVPAYPVGHWVEVITGAYQGWRGVVTHVEPKALDKPMVRLLIDRRNEPLNSPIEIDLRKDDDIELRCVPPGAAPFIEKRHSYAASA